MESRLNYFGHPLAGKVLKHLNPANKAVADSTLPPVVQELVKIRASQINGCGFCTDMHIKDAVKAGETAQRLNLVAAWREAKVFTEAERAALELAEQGTRIADAAGGVTDAAWTEAAEHFDEEQLIALVSLIAVINAYNRVNVINQQPASAAGRGAGGGARSGRPVPAGEAEPGRARRVRPAGSLRLSVRADRGHPGDE